MDIHSQSVSWPHVLFMYPTHDLFQLLLQVLSYIVLINYYSNSLPISNFSPLSLLPLKTNTANERYRTIPLLSYIVEGLERLITVRVLLQAMK